MKNATRSGKRPFASKFSALALSLLLLGLGSASAATLTNWASAGIATQSTDPGWGGPPAQAINGNYTDYTLTLNNDNEWWEVDLKGSQPIGHVHVWLVEGPGVTRGDDYSLRIVVYDSTNTATRVVQWETNYPGGFDMDSTTRDFGYNINPAITGRVVRVEHPAGTGNNYLAFAEVEVFNQPLVFASLTNHALTANGATATSSSVRLGDGYTFGPQRATDGNHNGRTYDGTTYFWSYFEADPATDPLPWWRVDLAAAQTIGGVVLWPQREANAARFDQLDVSVFDAGSNTLYQQVFTVRPTGSKFVVNFAPPISNAKFITVSTTTNTPDKTLNLPEVEVFAAVSGTPAITVISNLQPVTVEENRPVTFGPVAATVDGGFRPEELSYRWYWNGSLVPNAAGSWFRTLSLPAASQANNGDLYKVQVSVPGYGVFSSEVALTVLADTNAPYVVTNYTTVSAAFYMTLVFNEALNPTTATNPANYSLDGGPTLGDITLNADGKTVVIVVQNLLPGDSVALHVSGVKDLAGTSMSPAFFNAPYPAAAVNYALAGTATGSSAPYGAPAQAINGVTSGGTFFHSGNADNEWWEVDLQTAKQIGSVKVYFRNGFNHRDKYIDLVIYDTTNLASRVELLRTQVSTSTIPSNPTTLTLASAVTGRVVRLEHPSGAPLLSEEMYLCLAEVQVFPPPTGLVITPSPINWTVFEGDRVILRSGASGQTPISTQWKLNGTDVPGATGPTLVISNITSAQAGSYTFTATNAVRSRASAPAIVAVNPRPVLADSLVARYRFAADTGTTTLDDAPLNPAKTVMHDGTNSAVWVNSLTDGNSVTRSNVMQFDGTTVVSIPPQADLDSRIGAITFWVKGVASAGNFSAIMFDRRGGPNNWGDVFGFSVDDTLNPPVGALYCQNYSAQITMLGSKRVDDDLWHHVAYIYRYDPIGTMSFYIDAQLEAEKTDGAAGYWPATVDLRFGASRGWWANLVGCLDDIHIFNRTLSQTEIAQVMTTGVAPKLNISYSGGNVVLSWADASYVLQQNANLANPAGWADITPAPASPWTNALPMGVQFYRLHKP